MKEFDVQVNSRFGGLVTRFHTWPRINHQNTGEHSWQAMRIYYLIWGPLPPAVSTYLIWHDTGEVRAGDVPYHMKNKSEVKSTFDAVEDATVSAMGGPANVSRYAELTPAELARCKACDMLDIVEWSIVEIAFGNRFALPIFENSYKAMENFRDHKDLSTLDHQAISTYLYNSLQIASTYGVKLPNINSTIMLNAAQ